MSAQWIWIWVCGVCLALCACGDATLLPKEDTQETGKTERAMEHLSIDPLTGIPFAYTFRHPVAGFGADDYGFGFGLENRWFCMKEAPDGTCVSYGIHLGRDTRIPSTPTGTQVIAPADGIVRITTDIRFGGYGSDEAGHRAYDGCLVVLEHLLGTGEAITTLLGHLECGTGPAVGTLVSRGDPVGRVGHYWHGAGTEVDWHHVHWAIRKGRFHAAQYRKSDLLPYVKGYAPVSAFSVDRTTGALVHRDWIDPFTILATHGDSTASADENVRHHPSGSLLQDPQGTYWRVEDAQTIARIPSGVVQSDRYPTDDAIPVTQEEIGCYAHAADVASEGLVTLYVRPGSNAVVLAYRDTQERYDLITWEAFLSWGFQEGDISQGANASFFEDTYADRGFRLLRPGTLVKSDDHPEVSIVTRQYTRLPIASEEAFERAGFKWNRIMTVAASVIADVAGPTESRAFTAKDLTTCAVPPGCPGGEESCGGGGIPEPTPEPESLPGPPPEPQPEPECSPIGLIDYASCREGRERECDANGRWTPCHATPSVSEPEPQREPEPQPQSEPQPVEEDTENHEPSEPTVQPEPQPVSLPMEPEPVGAEPTYAPQPEPPPPPAPVVSSSFTIQLRASFALNDFSLWLLSGSSYIMPEETAQDCMITERSATCAVHVGATDAVEFWMYTGVPGTPWSPGLSWETGVCDPFADVTVWRGEAPVPLSMVPVGDGCHFSVEGE